MEKEPCPICLGVKEVYNGEEDTYTECTMCDVDGTVDSEMMDYIKDISVKDFEEF